MKAEEYRKSTAEALFRKESSHSPEPDLYYLGDKFICDESQWRPESNANHRDMVWDWMKKNAPFNIFMKILRNYLIYNESLFTATEKAWEQFNKKS